MKSLVIILAFALSAHAQYAWFTTGEQRTIVAVIGLGFQPDQAQVERARQAVFGTDSASVDSFYRAASHGQAWFVGDAVGVSIPADASCQVWGSTMQAADSAVGQRVDLELYTRRVYVLLGQSGCAFAGISTSGISFRFGERLYSLSWIVGFQSAAIFHHEVGHGVGLEHAGTYRPLSGKGDPSDVMGLLAHTFNAPNKLRLSWLAPSEVLEVTSGTFTITPLEVPGALKILKIRRTINEWGSWPEYLTISYRQPIGVYNASMHSGLTTGASIHVVQDTYPAGLYPFLVDTKPGSPYGAFDSALIDGACWYEPLNRVLIRQSSHVVGAGGSATVTVIPDASDPGCAAAPPPPPPIPPPPPQVCTPIGKSGKVKCR